MSNKETREKIKEYKRIKAEIVEISIAIEEAEELYLGITGIPQGERTSPTYKITSSVENQAEKHQEMMGKLLHSKFRRKNQLKRIDNALSVLDDIHEFVIKSALIENKKYSHIQKELNLSYQRIKEIEREALIEMERYIFPREYIRNV